MLLAIAIAAGIIALLILFLSIYFVCRYGAEEDDGDAWLPRVLIVVTLCAACYTVLLLPLEVAVTEERPTLDFIWVWKGMHIIAYFLLFVGGPFAFVFYESWSPVQSGMWPQIRPALIAVAAVNLVFVSSFGALWLWGNQLDKENSSLSHVPPFVYFVATVSSFGWCFFFVFAGVGLAAVPLGGFSAFIHRARPITKRDYNLTRVKLSMEVQRLLDAGRRLDAEIGGNRPNQKQRQKLLLFKRNVREVEQQSERNNTAFHLSGAYVLRSYFSLVVTVVHTGGTLLWLLHILLSNVLHIFALLDFCVCFLNGLLPMLATLAYAYCALYLMWCTVAGCRVVGGHVFLLPVYQLRVRGTMLNALLFNSLVLLCSSFAVLHLCVISFATYAAATSMHNMFAVRIAKLVGVRLVPEYLQYGLLIVFTMSFLWLTLCSRRIAEALSDDDEDDGQIL